MTKTIRVKPLWVAEYIISKAITDKKVQSKVSGDYVVNTKAKVVGGKKKKQFKEKSKTDNYVSWGKSKIGKSKWENLS